MPNSFYAKTGFSAEYWQSGLEYSYHFLRDYGLYGIAVFLPLLYWKKLSIFSRFGVLVFLGYFGYVAAVGGDVLKAHRFFVPVLVFFYGPFADAVFQLFGRRRLKNIGFACLMLLTGLAGWGFGFSYLKESARLENALVEKMKKMALHFSQKKDSDRFALTTIGAFSYYLGRRRVIDMLGLTEPAVARNPEQITGLVSSWKERHFNAGYVLSQKPDVILFSTGVKPSVPAERALFLYPDFRRNYRMEFIVPDGVFLLYYRRFQNLPTAKKPDAPVLTGNLFNEAVNFMDVERKPEKAIPVLRRLLENGPQDCPAFFTTLGHAYSSTRFSRPESAGFYLKKGVELDGGGSLSRLCLGWFFLKNNQYEAGVEQCSIVAEMVPEAAEFENGGKPLQNPFH